MSERPNEELSNVLEEAEQIIEEQLSSGLATAYHSPWLAPPIGYLRRLYDIPPPTDIKLRNWLELASRVRNLPRTEFVDEITELKHDMDYLRLRHRALEKDLEHLKGENTKLSKQLKELQSSVKTKVPTLSDLYELFVDSVSEVDFVQQVLVEETIDVSTIWTIINTTPFEDSLRDPIYDAEIKVLGMLKGDISLDFSILNVSELVDKQEVDSVIPPKAKLLWKR